VPLLVSLARECVIYLAREMDRSWTDIPGIVRRMGSSLLPRKLRTPRGKVLFPWRIAVESYIALSVFSPLCRFFCTKCAIRTNINLGVGLMDSAPVPGAKIQMLIHAQAHRLSS
jgi:hypothetical protein